MEVRTRCPFAFHLERTSSGSRCVTLNPKPACSTHGANRQRRNGVAEQAHQRGRTRACVRARCARSHFGALGACVRTHALWRTWRGWMATSWDAADTKQWWPSMGAKETYKPSHTCHLLGRSGYKWPVKPRQVVTCEPKTAWGRTAPIAVCRTSHSCRACMRVMSRTPKPSTVNPKS